MELFIGLTVISLIGIIAVIIIVKNDKGPGGMSVKKIDPKDIKNLSNINLGENPLLKATETPAIKGTGEKSAKKKFSFGGFGKKKSKPKKNAVPQAPAKLEKPQKENLGFLTGIFKKKEGKEPAVKGIPGEKKKFPSLKDVLSKEKDKERDTAKPPQSPRLEPETRKQTDETTKQNLQEPAKEDILSKEEEKNIESQVETEDELKALKEKHEKLEKLHQEKTDQLEKAQSSLDAELKTRKDFNKVKDVLEKELSDVKTKARETQVELNSIRAESESYKKRVNQLEEKATGLEKEIIEKEKENDELIKRLQTFASPSTASTPPVKKEPAPQTPPGQEAPSKAEQPPETAPTERPAPPEDAPSTETTAEPDIEQAVAKKDAGSVQGNPAPKDLKTKDEQPPATDEKLAGDTEQQRQDKDTAVPIDPSEIFPMENSIDKLNEAEKKTADGQKTAEGQPAADADTHNSMRIDVLDQVTLNKTEEDPQKKDEDTPLGLQPDILADKEQDAEGQKSETGASEPEKNLNDPEPPPGEDKKE